MRRKTWRSLRFGPAVVYEMADGDVARVHLWARTLAEPVHEGLLQVAAAELPEELRRRGARMWVVQEALGGGNYRTIEYAARDDGDDDMAAFERRWRRAHRRWWEAWKWEMWGWAVPAPFLR